MLNASDNNGSGGVTDGIVRVSRKGSTSSALTVYFSRSGTATPPGQTGEDYQIGIGGTFGNFTSVTIPSGSSYIDFLIHPVYDSYNVDGTESVVISLSASSAYTVDIQGVASTTPIY